MQNMIILIIAALLYSGIVGAVIGSNWNNAGSGFMCGLFMGPIGWIVITQIPASELNLKLETEPKADVTKALIEGCPHCGAKYDFSCMAPGVYTCGECENTFKLELRSIAAVKKSKQTTAQKCPRCKSKFESANLDQSDCKCPVCALVFKSAALIKS